MKTLKTFFCSSQRNLAKLVKVLKSFQLASLQLLDYAELLLKKMFASGSVYLKPPVELGPVSVTCSNWNICTFPLVEYYRLVHRAL